MNIVNLVIGIVRKGDTILLRKKPDGSQPYKETWYLFGGEFNIDNTNPESVLKQIIKFQTGINIKTIERIWWDTEIKLDSNGVETLYVYLDYLCEYLSGTPT